MSGLAAGPNSLKLRVGLTPYRLIEVQPGEYSLSVGKRL